jgi:glycosyltransferase involved in cell wall biosynthesis
MSTPKISVIVVTCGRPIELGLLLDSLSRQVYQADEVIVVDQRGKKNKKVISKIAKQFNHVSYVPSSSRNKSRSLNRAVSLAKNSIVAFTDDDCVADTHWLKEIARVFQKNQNISGMFGRSLPWQVGSWASSGRVCPAYFDKKTAHTLKNPDTDRAYIGYGHNMAFRKQALITLGGFVLWLGPGSMGKAGEDLEMGLRILLSERILFYEPRALVYHNRWLTFLQNQMQEASYVCGEVACFGYYGLSGYPFGWRYAFDTLRLEARQIRVLLLDLHLRTFLWAWVYIFWFIVKLFFRLRGFLIALWFAFGKGPRVKKMIR